MERNDVGRWEVGVRIRVRVGRKRERGEGERVKFDMERGMKDR